MNRIGGLAGAVLLAAAPVEAQVVPGLELSHLGRLLDAGDNPISAIAATVSASVRCATCTAGDTLLSCTQTSLDNCAGNPCDADLSIDVGNQRCCAGSNDQNGWAIRGICLRQ